jgi:hypothetical protein
MIPAGRSNHAIGRHLLATEHTIESTSRTSSPRCGSHHHAPTPARAGRPHLPHRRGSQASGERWNCPPVAGGRSLTCDDGRAAPSYL